MFVDESFRVYLVKEQQKIWQKSSKEDGADGPSTPFGKFFGETSPSGSDLPEY